MGIEDSMEKKVINLTRDQLHEMDLLFPKRHNDGGKFDALLKNIGIELNSGNITVILDGVEESLVSDESDFGTILRKTKNYGRTE